MLRKLEHTHQYHKHIIQIGNPIEFPNERRTQLPVDDNDSWGEALKDAMRMDPDVFSSRRIPRRGRSSDRLPGSRHRSPDTNDTSHQ